MRRSSELLKRLCLLALPIAALHAQSFKTGPEVGQQVPRFRPRTRTVELRISSRSWDPKAPCWSFFVLRIGDRSVKSSSWSCNSISMQSGKKDSASRRSVTIPWERSRVLPTASTSRIRFSQTRIRRSSAPLDILNETTKPGTLTYGIPYPGIYVVDAQGKVLSKYFEDDYKDRVSTADILARQFGAPVSAAQRVNETKHLKLTTSASNDLARPGLRIALSLKIELKPGMHLYAPGVQGYIPIDWQLEDGGPAAKRHAFRYPASEMLRLEAIDETVPVYRGRIRIEREITFGQEAALKPLVDASGELVVKGSFRYQACDDRKCYLPQDVPLEWHFKYEGLDRQRAPSEVQRKPN